MLVSSTRSFEKWEAARGTDMLTWQQLAQLLHGLQFASAAEIDYVVTVLRNCGGVGIPWREFLRWIEHGVPGHENRQLDGLASTTCGRLLVSDLAGLTLEIPASNTSALPDPFLGHEFDGVSIEYLRTTFLDEVCAVGLSAASTISEIEEAVIRGKGVDVCCPRDGQLGAAYIDCVRGEEGAGLATIMLSYCWAYTVGEIVESLVTFAAGNCLHPEDTYVWICSLCVNQHRVIEARAKGEDVPFEKFQATFQRRVLGIRHVVALMTPWRDPLYIKRVWCCYEMYTAIDAGGDHCQFSIIMPDSEAERFRRSLLENEKIDSIFSTLSSVRVEHAAATVQEDQDRILAIIEQGPGFANLNRTLVHHLQLWIVRVSEGYLRHLMLSLGSPTSPTAGLPIEQRHEQHLVVARLCARVGTLLHKVGLETEALQRLRDGLDLYQELDQLGTVEAASLLRSLGLVHQTQGRFDQALESYEQARQIRVALGQLESFSGAKLLQNIGVAKRHRGELDDARVALEEALRIHEAVGTSCSPAFADLLKDFGIVLGQCGALDEELDCFKRALVIREKTSTLQTPDGANLLSNLGFVRKAQGDLTGALEVCKQAKQIRELTSTLDTPDGATLLKNIGSIRRAQGKLAKSLKYYERACTIRSTSGTLETTKGANLLVSMGQALGEKGDVVSQGLFYEKARRIRQATGTLGSRGAKKLLGLISEVAPFDSPAGEELSAVQRFPFLQDLQLGWISDQANMSVGALETFQKMSALRQANDAHASLDFTASLSTECSQTLRHFARASLSTDVEQQ